VSQEDRDSTDDKTNKSGGIDPVCDPHDNGMTNVSRARVESDFCVEASAKSLHSMAPDYTNPELRGQSLSP